MTDDQIKSEIEDNESRAEWGAWAIVVGLVIEIVLAVGVSLGIDKKGLENWGAVVADCLIALGVYCEIHFGRKASTGNVELRRRSEERVAEANARAAAANQKAQEAILELARFKAPRVLTQEQRGRIVEKLKRFSDTEYDIAISDSDPEILSFVFTVELVLSSAGWVELNWQGSGQALIRQGQSLIRLGASVTNVVIGVHVNQPPKLLECASVLSDALTAEDIDATAGRHVPHEMSSTNANAIHILIGRKV